MQPSYDLYTGSPTKQAHQIINKSCYTPANVIRFSPNYSVAESL